MANASGCARLAITPARPWDAVSEQGSGRIVYDALQKQPGQGIRQLSHTTGLAILTVQTATRRLAAQGIIRVELDGRKKLHFPARPLPRPDAVPPHLRPLARALAKQRSLTADQAHEALAGKPEI